MTEIIHKLPPPPTDAFNGSIGSVFSYTLNEVYGNLDFQRLNISTVPGIHYMGNDELDICLKFKEISIAGIKYMELIGVYGYPIMFVGDKLDTKLLTHDEAHRIARLSKRDFGEGPEAPDEL